MRKGLSSPRRCAAILVSSSFAFSAGPLLAAPVAPAATAAPASADNTTSGVEEIVVTARKREESDISVPASISAIPHDQIVRQAILNMFDVAAINPSLTISNGGTAVGGNLYLRGVGTIASIANSLDQSVSFDINGVPISRGNVLRIGDYDLDQIEILKGPQALFFGKNSPAGVISMKSIDPTSTFNVMAKGSYEPYSNDRFAEFVVSGPVSDDLDARLFVHVGAQDGEKDNLAARALGANLIVPGAVTAPASDKDWGSSETFLRGTAIYKPNDRLSIKFIEAYDSQDGAGVGGFKERYYCPQGHAQNNTVAALLGATGPNLPALASALSVDDCKMNGTVFQGSINPAALNDPRLPSFNRDGLTGSKISISSVELNYALTNAIDLTSITSYVFIHEENYDNFTFGPASVPALDILQNAKDQQFGQELRVTSHFSSPLNFLVGAFFQDIRFSTYSDSMVPPDTNWVFSIPNRVYSLFGQGLWDIIPTVELAAGARLTEETKSLLLTRSGVQQPTANPSVTFYNASPEATLTWRPTSELTAYVAYKTGYKSGGYADTISGNAAPLPTTAPLRDFLYKPESSKGFEVGLKAALFDRSLRLDTTIYSYEYDNRQVSFANPSVLPPVQQVFNSAASEQRGVEVEGSYYPRMINGLRINGDVNYNDSYYSKFNAPCYVGQSIAEGCSLTPVAGAFTQQDLSGREVTNAPKWVGSLGFSYSMPIAWGRLEFGADGVYKSVYNASSDLTPGALQNASTTLSAQVRLISADGHWEFGVYGKNLTNVYSALDSIPVPLTGNSANTGTVRGGIASRADLAGDTNPGRAVFLQLAYHLR